jgi:hypothetical protein
MSTYCIVGAELIGKVTLILGTIYNVKPESKDMTDLGEALQKFNEHAASCLTCVQTQSKHQ